MLQPRPCSGLSSSRGLAPRTRPSCVREPLAHSVNYAVLGLDVSYDRNWNHWFEIAEYSNGMEAWGFLWPSLVWRFSVSRFVFLCVVTPSPPKDLFKGILKLPCPALVFTLLWFSRDFWEVQTLWSWVRWLWTGFWIHSARFEPTFSIPEIDDKTRVDWRTKA